MLFGHSATLPSPLWCEAPRASLCILAACMQRLAFESSALKTRRKEFWHGYASFYWPKVCVVFTYGIISSFSTAEEWSSWIFRSPFWYLLLKKKSLHSFALKKNNRSNRIVELESLILPLVKMDLFVKSSEAQSIRSLTFCLGVCCLEEEAICIYHYPFLCVAVRCLGSWCPFVLHC